MNWFSEFYLNLGEILRLSWNILVVARFLITPTTPILCYVQENYPEIRPRWSTVYKNLFGLRGCFHRSSWLILFWRGFLKDFHQISNQDLSCQVFLESSARKKNQADSTWNLPEMVRIWIQDSPLHPVKFWLLSLFPRCFWNSEMCFAMFRTDEKRLQFF